LCWTAVGAFQPGSVLASTCWTAIAKVCGCHPGQQAHGGRIDLNPLFFLPSSYTSFFVVLFDSIPPFCSRETVVETNSSVLVIGMVGSLLCSLLAMVPGDDR
jgi:hypothetical protein